MRPTQAALPTWIIHPAVGMCWVVQRREFVEFSGSMRAAEVWWSHAIAYRLMTTESGAKADSPSDKASSANSKDVPPHNGRPGGYMSKRISFMALRRPFLGPLPASSHESQEFKLALAPNKHHAANLSHDDSE
ncbi:hypothetical protein C8R43DRAFT_1178781 [Mycena crocata]|nr:hypothetical protein C8R43DRAFT_1178781 [Mycena crocata]